jgi:hypothetical protein
MRMCITDNVPMVKPSIRKRMVDGICITIAKTLELDGIVSMDERPRLYASADGTPISTVKMLEDETSSKRCCGVSCGIESRH